MTRALLGLLLLAAAAPALAGDAARALPEVASFPTPLAGTLARMLAALAAISGAGAGLAWWSRRRRGISSASPSRIQVIASRAIGPRHQLVLVEVGERRLLLGTGPESVRALADLSEGGSFEAQLARELPDAERAGGFETLDA